ncbi:MAG TPA: hypothetical protein VHN77_10535, partial [Phycisphaerales bacterium]|nr:hypothetical protein [Phycisphaerales bacterium]
MHISRHCTPLALTALAGCAITASHTRAAIINWTSASGGTATTLTNWSPQALPTASDTINFNIVGGYIVTWGAGAPSTVTNLHVGTSNAGFNFVTPLTVTGDCIIQNVSSSAGGASTISSGTLTVANLAVGAAPHPTVGGQFHINGATAHLNVNNSCILGSANTALLRVLAGASMNSSTTVRVGATANGTMVVSGAVGAPADRSTLQLTGAANSLRVGDGSQGSLTISDGALATMSGDAFAGPVSGVQGSITVTGSTGGLDATLTIPGNLYIANNNAASAAGVGTVRIQPGSSVSVAGQTIVGDSSPSSGLLEVSGGTFLTHGLVASG